MLFISIECVVMVMAVVVVGRLQVCAMVHVWSQLSPFILT